MDDLGSLISYAINNNVEFKEKLAILALRYSKDTGTIKLARALLTEQLEVDMWELESLVNSDKFKFPIPDIEDIGVELK